MIKVSFLGAAGSFSFIAAHKYFQKKIPLLSFLSIKGVFDSLKNRTSNYGVIPIENSTSGSILETYDELLKNKMKISGEIRLRIHHNLLVLGNRDINKITKCYSHPQGIIQCSKFFDRHPWIAPQVTTDTASGACVLSKSKNRNIAAIASSECAGIYGLKITKKNIEDNKNNFTRFAVISHLGNKSGQKATIAFLVKHVPGSLFKALKPYAEVGLNLTKIESRPIFGKSWEYIFFIDFEIKNQISKFIKMIALMKKVTEEVTVLGLYDQSKIYET